LYFPPNSAIPHPTSTSVHALNGEEGTRRLINPNLEDCIHVWEAARGTSAAFPHFAPYTKGEKKLLDGGFKANCPAQLGYTEARHIWPEKSLDVLVSLGTGTFDGKPAHLPKNLVLKVGRGVVRAITNSTQLWKDFLETVEDKSRCHRLDPLLTQDFGLTDVKNMSRISDDTNNWLKYQIDPLATVSNELVASLFFCTSDPSTNADTLICNISCRLSHAIEGRAELIDRLIEVADRRDLFTVKSSNHATIHFDAKSALSNFRRMGSQGPIAIPVIISHPPPRGEVKIRVGMADIFRDDRLHLYPISGMPYIFRKHSAFS
jgi:hypothetical protein